MCILATKILYRLYMKTTLMNILYRLYMQTTLMNIQVMITMSLLSIVIFMIQVIMRLMSKISTI